MIDLTDKTFEYIEGYKQGIIDFQEKFYEKIPNFSKTIAKDIVDRTFEMYELYLDPIDETRS